MSQTTSPTRFSGDYELYDSNFTADISEKMRVPKRIKVNGDNDDDGHHGNGVGMWGPAVAHEKFDMQVPDRILVVGQEQHYGTRAPPRELTLENAVMPQHDVHAGFTRVQTPPRIITLDDHYFPSADDFETRMLPESPPEKSTPRLKRRIDLDQRLLNSHNSPGFHIIRESTPPLGGGGGGGDGLTASEEIVHLRRQMAKLNRRVMAVEIDNLQRQQREKILYAIGLCYIFVKTVFWLNRSS